MKRGKRPTATRKPKPRKTGAPTVSKDAAAQLARVLALIPRIADGEEHPLADAAAVLDVGRETVLADLESIAKRFDDPGGFVEGLQVFIDSARVSVHTNHFLRPMRLTVPELHALDLGLAMLRAERPPDESHAIDGARERIRTLVAKLPAGDVPKSSHHASATAVATATQMPAIRKALSKHTKLRIDYRRGDALEASTRTIHPYRMIFASGTWYLVAHCERSEGVRVFRLDRIQRAELLSDAYAMPDESLIAEHVAGGRVFSADTSERLRIRYSAQIARWIRERERGTAQPDGSFVVEHPLADVDWAVRHVLQYGPEAEVIEPAAVREAVRRRLESMLL